MLSRNIEMLRSVKSLSSLIKYLRDKLDWPIESDNFEDPTFDYEPENDDDTKLKIDHVVHTLAEKMRWPDNEDDAETWRRKWSDAFKLRPWPEYGASLLLL